MYCSSCGIELQKTVKFCPECGTSVLTQEAEKVKIACPCCHQKILITSKWCGKEFQCPGCGNRIVVPMPEKTESEDIAPLHVPELVNIDDELDVPNAESPLFELQEEPVLKKAHPNRNISAAMIISIAAGVLLFLCVLALGGYILYSCFDGNSDSSADTPEVVREDLEF